MKKAISRQGRSGSPGSLIKTFTFFIPAPSARKSGYREREFDKIMQGLLTSGFDIVELKTQSVGGEHGGMFVLAIIKAKNKKVFELDLTLDLHEKFKLSHSHSSPDIILEEEDA